MKTLQLLFLSLIFCSSSGAMAPESKKEVIAEQEICGICLTEPVSGKKWPEVINMCHPFHASCLHGWIVEKKMLSCPLCRKEITPFQAAALDMANGFPMLPDSSDQEREDIRKHLEKKAENVLKVFGTSGQANGNNFNPMHAFLIMLAMESHHQELHGEVDSLKKNVADLKTASNGLIVLNALLKNDVTEKNKELELLNHKLAESNQDIYKLQKSSLPSFREISGIAVLSSQMQSVNRGNNFTSGISLLAPTRK